MRRTSRRAPPPPAAAASSSSNHEIASATSSSPAGAEARRTPPCRRSDRGEGRRRGQRPRDPRSGRGGGRPLRSLPPAERRSPGSRRIADRAPEVLPNAPRRGGRSPSSGSRTTTRTDVSRSSCSRTTPSEYVLPDPDWPQKKVWRSNPPASSDAGTPRRAIDRPDLEGDGTPGRPLEVPLHLVGGRPGQWRVHHRVGARIEHGALSLDDPEPHAGAYAERRVGPGVVLLGEGEPDLRPLPDDELLGDDLPQHSRAVDPERDVSARGDERGPDGSLIREDVAVYRRRRRRQGGLDLLGQRTHALGLGPDARRARLAHGRQAIRPQTRNSPRATITARPPTSTRSNFAVTPFRARDTASRAGRSRLPARSRSTLPTRRRPWRQRCTASGPAAEPVAGVLAHAVPGRTCASSSARPSLRSS